MPRIQREITRSSTSCLVDSPPHCFLIVYFATCRARGGHSKEHAERYWCFAAGLRVSELIGLPLTAVEFQPMAQVRVRGKGRNERALPLWKETASDLRAWLAVRGEAPVPELFLNAPGAGDESVRL